MAGFFFGVVAKAFFADNMEGRSVDAAIPMVLVLMKFLLDTLFSFIVNSPFLSDFFKENIQKNPYEH